MGLSQPLVVQKDHGVGGDDDVAGVAGNGVRLLPGDIADDLRRAELRRIPLLHVRHPDDTILDPDPPQQLLAAGGTGTQNDACHGASASLSEKKFI